MPTHGEVGRGRNRVDNININPGGTDATYLLKRLKRDAPALAQQVVSSEKSAYAAPCEAGIKKRHPHRRLPQFSQLHTTYSPEP